MANQKKIPNRSHSDMGHLRFLPHPVLGVDIAGLSVVIAQFARNARITQRTVRSPLKQLTK